MGEGTSPSIIKEGTSTAQMANPVVESESTIMKMHQKMKNLETRYLDLANFYKRELLTHVANSSQMDSNMF